MEKYSPYGKYNPFDQSYHQNRRMIAYEEMVSEKELIKEVFKSFTNTLNTILMRNGGAANNNEIEVCIQRSYLRSKRLESENQKDICEGFFDTYLGIWRDSGREFANAWAKKIFK